MKPYYERGGIQLFHGDCLEILPELEAGSVDAVVTDPPYENMKGGTVINHAGVSDRIVPSVTVGCELGSAEALPMFQRIASKGAIAFCSFHWIEKCVATLGGHRKALISWYKRNSPYSVQNAPWFVTEYAWAVQYAPGIDWRNLRTHIDEPMLQAGCMASERICDGGKSVHKAQKPIAVMEAVLCPGMDSVLDPYIGLGTTAVACIRTNRKCIGIELEERYIEIAAKRCDRELDQGTLFKPEPAPRETQRELAIA